MNDENEWKSMPTKKKKDQKKKEDPVIWTQPFPVIAPPPHQNTTANAPHLLLLCGFPGSGKSTFAKELCRILPWKYVRVNQDELKTRDKCIAAVQRAWEDRAVVVLDRCNFDRKQRQHFLTLSTDAVVDCIVFDVPADTCLRRCQLRRGHPTLAPAKAGYVIRAMEKSFVRPSVKEGFRNIWHVGTDVSSLERALQRLVGEAAATNTVDDDARPIEEIQSQDS